MAKKITREEAKRIGMRPLGKKHFMHRLIDEMEKDEMLHITREDFRWKRGNPSIFTGRTMRKTNKIFTVMKTKSGLGWVVERVK